jgi:hypothetical protein
MATSYPTGAGQATQLAANLTVPVEQLTPLLASPLEHLHSRRMTDPA